MNPATQANIPQIGPDEARTRQQAGALIVDVREPDEWQAGHIAGAKHIPLGQLHAREAELDPAQELVLVCHSGRRSQSAAQALRHAGYADVSNLAGGMVAWQQHHLPITR